MELRNETYYLIALFVAILISVSPLIFLKRKKRTHQEISPELILEKKKFIYALVFPCFFTFLIWFVKFIEISLKTDFSTFGIFPREWKGLTGIITAPLVHDDFKHLFDNSIPLFILSLTIFYFYREISYKIFFVIYFVTGLLVWIGGREAYHIGASGLIYGFAAFLFFSGVIRRNVNLLSISLMVTFLYGSLIWGILPFDYEISWESHLLGAITGTAISVVYRDMGPKKITYSWEEEEEEEETDR